MEYNTKRAGRHIGLPQRKSIRLKGYDYSQAGLYFVTICTQNRLHLFGEIAVGAGPRACPKMKLNDAGEMIEQIWNEIPDYYNGFDIHQSTVMPNHFHGIIEIIPDAATVGAGPRACPHNGQPTHNGQPRGVAPTVAPTDLGDIVHRFKTLTTKRYAHGVKNNGWQRFDKKLWQRNYWEHIIRNENEYHRIAQYIVDNPQKWTLDKLNNGDGNMVMESPAIYTAVGAGPRACPNEEWMI